MTFEDDVVAVVRRLGTGEVVSYGEVAAQAGHPGSARGVGAVLRKVDRLPWWRVVAHDGRLISPDPDRQARLLRREGVAVEGARVVSGSAPGSC